MELQLKPEPGGRYTLAGPGGVLSGLQAGVQVGDERLLASAWAGLSTEPGLTADLGVGLTADLGRGLSLTLRAEAPEAGIGVLLTLTLTNNGPAPLAVGRLLPLVFGRESALRCDGAPASKRWAVYKQGYQSWSYTGWRPLDGADVHPRSFMTRAAHSDPSWPAPVGPGHFQSESMLMLGSPDGGPVLLAGFIAGARQFGRLELWAGIPMVGMPEVRLEAWCEGDGVLLAPGGSISAEPLMIALAPERTALAAYASACGRSGAARVPARSPAVWCSWYYHFTGVREEDVLDAARELAVLRTTHPVDVVQLDDGYQAAVGDWLTPNRKFPHGLPWLAEQIRSAGFVPGLWLAPFIALRSSRLFREHRDWFVRGSDGKPCICGWNPGWRDVYYGLDTTHPEAQRWLTDLIRQVTQAGFGYLKLDFLYGAAVAGVRHDPGATRAAALRTGLDLIRQAAGPDVFLLGCGSPMLPAVGVVDAMRVGPDVAPDWSFRFAGLPMLRREPGVASLKNALRGALTRQWMHGRLWANDPDSLILRERKSNLSREEARALASVGGLSGGILSFSDPPRLLTAERLNWLQRVLPPTGQGFQPVTLLAEEFPFLSTFRQGDWLLVLAVNGTNEHRLLTLPASEVGPDCHVYDCWTGYYLGQTRTGADMGDVPPHGCRVLALRAAGSDPVVVGTTFRLSPAEAVAATAWDGRALAVRLMPATRGRGSLTVAVPFLAGEPWVQAEGLTLIGRRRGHPGELILDVATEGGGSLLVGWESELEVQERARG